MIVTWI